ncbi:DNRLRE domain-containing protein [Brevibacillus brevis]|uniref:DNRLRE domain-containing protein n=1 Tax=Brevibacillus brevis TaxID=1393 RepID=UPI00165DDABD|nr:DNRLRE domain-containing protein [Brevibacillus brevis]
MPVVKLERLNTSISDTFIVQASPTSSYGTADSLQWGNGSAGLNDKLRALLIFDLGLIPNNAVINSATLYLYNVGNAVSRQTSIHKITSAWDQNTNWNNQPTFESTPKASFPSLSADASVQVDVKTIVQEWVNGSPNFGFLLKDIDEVGTNTQRSVGSKEASTEARRPTLTIDYSIPTTGKKQVDFVGAGTTNNSSSISSITLNLPTGYQLGDLLIAHIATSGTLGTTPSSWTKLADDVAFGSRFAVYYKYASATETPPVFTNTAGNVNWLAYMTCFRNVKQIDTSQVTTTSTASQTIAPPNTATTHDKTVFILLNGFVSQVSSTSPLNYREILDIYGNSYALEMSFRYMYTNKSQTSSDMTTTTVSAAPGASRSLVLVPKTNNPPTLSLTSPSDNQTLTEGATYALAGTASDPDSGNAVTVRYAINGGTARNITSAISDGVSPIPFSNVLTFQNGRLYDGATDVSGPLAENTTYTVNAYAVDDQGGTSTSYTRSFKVILNRPPNIVLDAYNANRTGLSELETLVFTGTVSDPENDNVNLTVAFNGGEPVPLKAGVPSGTTFEYVVPVSALANGTNKVVFTATDTKGAAKTKTLTFVKSGTQTPVKTAVVRYTITPPLGTTAEIVTWINREAGDLTVAAARSIVASNAAESFVAMTKNASVPIGDGTIYEDEFVGTATPAGAKVTLKLTLTRADPASTKAIKKIMGGIG